MLLQPGRVLGRVERDGRGALVLLARLSQRRAQEERQRGVGSLLPALKL